MPTEQRALRMAAFAAVRPKPKTFGTVQGIPPVVELVVNVSVASPDPIVTDAAPDAGVFDEITLAVPP
jgi:hypothetical protein